MQLEDLTPRIAPLPQPGLIERLTLESPMTLVASLVVIGLAGVLVLNTRGRLKAGLVVLVLAGLLAGGIALIAGLIQTPRETLLDRTRALVTALAEVDRASLHAMLDPEAEVQVRGMTTFRGRETILSTADRYVGNGAISSHAIPEVQGVIDGPNAARTQVRVRHSGSVPPASWWKITWYRASVDEPWTAVRIEPLWISGRGNL